MVERVKETLTAISHFVIKIIIIINKFMEYDNAYIKNEDKIQQIKKDREIKKEKAPESIM
jgi:hypothetical protein